MGKHKKPYFAHLDFIPRGGSTIFADHCECVVQDYRAPKKGEWYVSGAKPQAYQAPNDLGMEFWIVTKGAKMRQQMQWVRA